MYAPKLEYLVGEFSRARNKRYESYVVNRIWGLVCDLPLRPRTQMYAKVRDSEGNARRRFIDLCFPEIGLAVECDEAQHAQNAEEDAAREREIEASDVLDGIFSGELEFRRVAVYDRTWEDVERQIEEVATEIRERAGKDGMSHVVIEDEGRAWSFLEPARWCAGHKRLSVGDPVRFTSIAQACNCVFGCDYKESSTGPRSAFFTPAVFRGSELEGWKAWFPHLFVKGQTGADRWRNELDRETAEILETPPEGKTMELDDRSHQQKRLVFVKGRQPITGKRSYQFAGCYEFAGAREGRFVYRRFSESTPILRRQA